MNKISNASDLIMVILAATFGVCIVAITCGLLVAMFVFGDGEAQKIISDLTPPLLGFMAASGAVFLGHQIATSQTTKQAISASMQAAVSAGTPMPGPADVANSPTPADMILASQRTA